MRDKMKEFNLRVTFIKEDNLKIGREEKLLLELSGESVIFPVRINDSLSLALCTMLFLMSG